MIKKSHYAITVLFLLLIILLGPKIVDVVFPTPSNSLELYQFISASDSYEDVKRIMLDGSLTLEEYESIVDENQSPSRIRQFTVLEYGNNKSILIETTPGLKNLIILNVDELPNELKDYFYNLTK